MAVFEIISRGNKTGRQNFQSFMEKANGCFQRGIHFSFVDVHPPGNLDPDGIHGAICRERAEEPPQLLPGKILAAAGYKAADIVCAYVDPFGVGDDIPSIPLFLRHDYYVSMPLEETYKQAFSSFPAHIRKEIEAHR